MNTRVLRNIVLIWLAWSVILIGYMLFAATRYAPFRPDEALTWTEFETNVDSLVGRTYLLDPFLNSQVAWDSEYYLSIATVGYEDEDIAIVERDGEAYPKSYAFFPFYPYLMKVVRLPFTLFGLSPIAASALAGVLISLFGTLAGMIALYDIVRNELGEEGGIRTAWLMLIFPLSVFFAVVYTEGLFVGLAFGSLALMRRKNLFAAAVLAVFATWTRSIGATLVLPLFLTWGQMYRCQQARLVHLLPVAMPVAAYGLWRLAFGAQFDFVEAVWFRNGLLQIEFTINRWKQLLERAQTVPETAAYVVMTVSLMALAVFSCLYNARRYPELALFGLFALLIPFTAGGTSTNSMARYVLAVPTLWVMLGQWSRNPVFERSWTLLSILLLAMQAFLFSFDFWVA